MSYREISEDRVLKFPGTPGFKGWEPFFTPDSTTHPAKMCLNLLRWILETFTSPNDTVLDPMAGTGSTMVLASLLGRHGVAVEYEPRFCEMIRENIVRTERQTTLTPKGGMTCIQGDARELSKLLEESDTIITSPPYGEAQSGGGIAVKGYDGPKHSPTDLVGERSYMPDKFEGKGNISRLKYGEPVDVVVTSPPYESTYLDGKDVERRIERLKEAGHDPKDFIGGQARDVTLKNYDKVDVVVTSPPYEGSVPAYDEGWLEEHWDDDRDSPKHKTMRFGRSMRSYPKKVDTVVMSPPYSLTREGSDRIATGIDVKTGKSLWSKTGSEFSEGNIQKLPHGDVDAVVTSPPYGNRLADDVVQDGDEARMSYRQAIDSIVTSPPYEEGLRHRGQNYEEVREKLLAQGYSEEYIKASWSQPHQCQRWAEEAYGEDSDNIGNLKSESYLEAMLQVFRECYKALKNTGVMVLVVKNFIRDKEVVRLDEDTIKLCEAAGFRLSDRWYFKLPQRSFWRILYKRRYPDVPEVEYEDVIVFEKESMLSRAW
uniref:site-specific DNA-methyltransferase (cytosine-N(4)-specific) n=3 Tax=viral metagenome TaxID=1070528 RepID=A0A6M3M8Z8_9ZZZZ